MYITTVVRASLVIRTLPSQGGDLTYDEALSLYESTMDIIKDLGPLDPARVYFLNQARMMARWMDALNIFHRLDRTEHLTYYKVYIVGLRSKEIDEITVALPSSVTHFHDGTHNNLLGAIKYYAQQLHVDPGLTKLPASDVIEEVTFAD